MKNHKSNNRIPVFNLEIGLPTLAEASKKLRNLIDTNNHRGNQKERIIKIIHGYGSSGVGGGLLKKGLQKWLEELEKAHSINGFICGQDFGKHTIAGAKLSKDYPYIVNDRDYNNENIGMTIIIFNK